MTDPHIRLLRQLARQSQRELERHDTVEHAGDAASTREYLERMGERTRARVADAEQRRSRRAYGHRDTPAQITAAYRSEETHVAAPIPSARKARP